MQNENWSCPKCSQQAHEEGEIRVSGSLTLSLLTNIPNKKFKTVTCSKCSYTEFYKA